MEMMKIKKEQTSQLFDKPTISVKKFIVFFLWLKTGPECTKGQASRELTVQTGGSVVIPCYYDRKYTEHKKYWCFDASAAYNYCSILAYANETKGKVSVIDHPDQSFFTVTMSDLQNTDIGSYWCAVEIGGILQIDETEQLHLTVQSAPDVSVESSSVSGHEGGYVSVQCFYSSGYQNNRKQWCRYKDQSCYTEKRTDTSQNSSVQISDDGRSSFTVLMTGLRRSDSGWYFCSAGEALNPVHLTVTEAEPVNEATDSLRDLNETGNKNTTITEGSEGQNIDLSVWLPVSAALLLLLILLAVFTWRWRRRPKQDKHQNRERNDSRNIVIYSNPEEDPVIYNTINDEPSNDPNKDITYSTIGDAPGSEAKPPAGGAIYSTVAPH